MTSTFTTNIQLEEPARGDDVGTWDVPVNANMTLIDKVVGGIAGIPLTNANVILSAAQFQSQNITFTGTLTGSVAITFPTSFTKSYTIRNATTSASQNLTITLQTTASGLKICVPPGDIIGVYNDAANLFYTTLERVGTVVEFCSLTVPPWITGCTVPPYVPCNGGAFSSAAYPGLFNQIGSGTTPDLRGRMRIMINAGTGRVTTAGSGIDGDSLFAAGGDQLLTSHTHTGTTGNQNANHTHGYVQTNSANTTTGGGAFPAVATTTQTTVQTGAESAVHQHVFTSNATGGGASQNMPPAAVSGLVMIRAG